MMRWEQCPGNIYVVLESERDWTGETRTEVVHVVVAVRL